MKYAWKSHKITVSPIKWQSTLPPFPWKRRHDMNKSNDDEGRQLFHKTDTESALTYPRKYFNIFSGVQWSFSNRLLQWVWIMHRYLLTYIYISKKKNSADFISSIFIFTLSIYIDDVQRILVRSASLLDMHLEYDPTAPLSWLWQMRFSFLVV